LTEIMANTTGIPIWREIGASPAPSVARDSAAVLIVGAGPVGLTLALDLGLKGHDVIVVNKLDFIAAGSKAICFSKRTLDIWQRLGVAEEMVRRGVSWNVGKVFRGARPEPIYQFDMLPVKQQRMPGFINLQQYHCEDILSAAVAHLPNVQLRWGHELTDLLVAERGAVATIRAAAGEYEIEADWLIACDGVKSTTRALMNLSFEGRAFEDNFLIADIELKEQRPAERWFWFDPPFNPGRSALLHKQPDDVWRLDFQLGRDIDRAFWSRPENVDPLVRGILGDNIAYKPVWYSLYTFQCRRMSRFVHGRVLFAGDAAHLVSPFGARGCNGGVADADNLAWKLDLVLRKEAPESLIESYNVEATETADENIRHSTRATDFITPKSEAGRLLRDSVLDLAETAPFARALVNSGRLSTPTQYAHSPLSTMDEGDWEQGPAPGGPPVDAPCRDGWLLDHLGGKFVILSDTPLSDCRVVQIAAEGGDQLVRERYDLQSGSAYLFRPDQYVAARWRFPTPEKVRAAVARATGAA